MGQCLSHPVSASTVQAAGTTAAKILALAIGADAKIQVQTCTQGIFDSMLQCCCVVFPSLISLESLVPSPEEASIVLQPGQRPLCLGESTDGAHRGKEVSAAGKQAAQ
jgi:hypothetical protein